MLLPAFTVAVAFMMAAVWRGRFFDAGYMAAMLYGGVLVCVLYNLRPSVDGQGKLRNGAREGDEESSS